MKLLVIAALLAAGASFAQNSVPTPADAVNWKLATGYRTESFHTQNVLQFSRDVDKSTAGKLFVEVHPTAQRLRTVQGPAIDVERIPPDLEQEIKRMGEKFSREWVRSVGNEANGIFVPYYIPLQLTQKMP